MPIFLALAWLKENLSAIIKSIPYIIIGFLILVLSLKGCENDRLVSKNNTLEGDKRKLQDTVKELNGTVSFKGVQYAALEKAFSIKIREVKKIQKERKDESDNFSKWLEDDARGRDWMAEKLPDSVVRKLHLNGVLHSCNGKGVTANPPATCTDDSEIPHP